MMEDGELTNDANDRYSVYIENLPMSPSSNTQYNSFFKSGKNRRVKAGSYLDYENEMKFHYLENMLIHKNAMVMIRQWVNNKEKFQFNAVFYFKKSRLFTKDGRTKKLDLSNRIKALHDVICKHFGFDDSEIFRLFCEKGYVSDDQKERITIEIFPITA